MLDMTQAITVREAGEDDRDLLLDLYRQLILAHGADRTPEEFRERLDTILSAPYRAHLLEVDGAVIGSAIWMEMGDHVFLRHFTIDSARRGQGLGARAFVALEAACFPGREVELVASNDIDAPLAFWRAQGFTPAGTSLRREAKDFG